MLGPTGAGKTTFVDAFVNFVLGIEMYDKFRYKLVDEKQIENKNIEELTAQGKEVTEEAAQTMSMTSTVTIYHIPADVIVKNIGSKKCCINIIDTPGFGDTRGHGWDWKIFNMVNNLLNTMNSLNYMLLVVKATEMRLTSSSNWIYKQVESLYSEDLAERMLGVFTFSDGGEPLGYTAVTAAGISMGEKFKFNNSAMFSSKLDKGTIEYFELGEESFTKFVEYMEQKDALPISLNSNKQILAQRKAC